MFGANNWRCYVKALENSGKINLYKKSHCIQFISKMSHNYIIIIFLFIALSLLEHRGGDIRGCVKS